MFAYEKGVKVKYLNTLYYNTNKKNKDSKKEKDSKAA